MQLVEVQGCKCWPPSADGIGGLFKGTEEVTNILPSNIKQNISLDGSGGEVN
jgi:hypothetical protein